MSTSTGDGDSVQSGGVRGEASWRQQLPHGLDQREECAGGEVGSFKTFSEVNNLILIITVYYLKFSLLFSNGLCLR